MEKIHDRKPDGMESYCIVYNKKILNNEYD